MDLVCLYLLLALLCLSCSKALSMDPWSTYYICVSNDYKSARNFELLIYGRRVMVFI